ncbi:beta/alpha barrel domain-containing protein [Jatrophihabitans fulvus]
MTSLLDVAPVVPVVVIEDVAHAVPMAQALRDGGIPIAEITLRTPAALDAIRAIADEVPEVVVGAGTVCTPAQAALATDAGAQFLVSPGSTSALLDAFEAIGLPFLAGCATPSDMMRLLERGVTEAKLFPATAVGGVPLLKAVGGPLPQLRFCPTGGISSSNAASFLELPNVGCVGGSWLTPADAMRNKEWSVVENAAREASALRR